MRCWMWVLALVTIAEAGSIHAQQVVERFAPYCLHRSDVIEVKYRFTPEFDQTVSVGPDGRVTLNAAGTFLVLGLTVEQVTATVTHLSSARLLNPEVSVVLKEYDKPHVLVEGEVATPGRVDLRDRLTALDAIALAGGFKGTSSKSKILLLREEGGVSSTRILNLKKDIDGGKLEEVSELREGDVIYVTQDNLSKVERWVHLGQFGAYYNPAR